MLYTQKKYKIQITIILLIFAVLFNACSAQKYSNKFQPTAKDGVLNLHDWDFEKDGPVELKGDWEFYWKKLISPEVFKKNQAITERELIYVPGNWNNHKYKNQSHDGFGYATYRLKVLLGKNYNDLSFKFMTISTSYIFFVNGLRITSEGVVGTTAETARPEYRLSIADYGNETKELDIVLHVSNFTHSQGGLWDKITIGPKKQIYRLYLTETCIELFMIGSMLIIALYHLVVYLFRKKYIAPLFFALLCLHVCLRTLFGSNYIIKIIFPDFPVYLVKRVEHLIIYFAPSILMLYVSSLFENKIKKIILYSALAISFLFSLLFFTPESFFPQFLMYAQMFGVLSFCYILYTAFKSIIQKEEGAKLFTIGLIMLFLFFLNDVLYSNYILMILPNTIPFGIFLFIFIQSVILARRFSNAFTTVETLSCELKDYSQNLEKKVEERTEELVAANEEMLALNESLIETRDELVAANDEMTAMNENLSETRDQLWGEMELARKMQTVLLPTKPAINGYEILPYMKPADEVGGDYYDIINCHGYDWLVIGDVSGHGFPAGLIMMMVQTAIHTTLERHPDDNPSALLSIVNKALKKNLTRLDEDKYMTITVFAVLKEGNFSYSGLHQDILIYRQRTKKVEVIETNGFWIGLIDKIDDLLLDNNLSIEVDDIILLYTDGITEAWQKDTIEDHRCPKIDMYGNTNLIKNFEKYAEEGSLKKIQETILQSLDDYEYNDDITMVLIKRIE